MARCQLTDKGPLWGYNVSHAHNKSKKMQAPNIQKKRIWVPEMGKWVRLDLSTRAIRTVNKIGLAAYARKLGIPMKKLVG